MPQSKSLKCMKPIVAIQKDDATIQKNGLEGLENAFIDKELVTNFGSTPRVDSLARFQPLDREENDVGRAIVCNIESGKSGA